MRLKGKTALITGGNSGIGLATARRFVAEGARVAISGRDEATLAAAANELGVTAIRSDVLDAQARSSLFDRIKDEFGHLDIYWPIFSLRSQQSGQRNHRYRRRCSLRLLYIPEDRRSRSAEYAGERFPPRAGLKKLSERDKNHLIIDFLLDVGSDLLLLLR